MMVMMYYTNQYWFIAVDFRNISPILPVFLFTFIYPAIAILLLRKLNFVDSLEMPDTKQRIIPLMITIILYIWTYLVIKDKHFPLVMRIYMLGAISSLILAFVINVFHKLSLHMVGMSGTLICVLLLTMVSHTDVSYFLLWMIITTGLVATSRLYLHAHTMREVYTGFMVGVFGQIIGLIWIQ